MNLPSKSVIATPNPELSTRLLNLSSERFIASSICLHFDTSFSETKTREYVFSYPGAVDHIITMLLFFPFRVCVIASLSNFVFPSAMAISSCLNVTHDSSDRIFSKFFCNSSLVRTPYLLRAVLFTSIILIIRAKSETALGCFSKYEEKS